MKQPGSQEAQDAGCTCPVIDNSHGRGYAKLDGKTLFVMNDNCPIHGTIATQAEGNPETGAE